MTENHIPLAIFYFIGLAGFSLSSEHDKKHNRVPTQLLSHGSNSPDIAHLFVDLRLL